MKAFIREKSKLAVVQKKEKKRESMIESIITPTAHNLK
jgi:hypothetical protein